jgi:eukaryotic-like serine/threonine-protein kinase
MSYESGQVVNGRYRMLNQLGAGAQGVVFRARDLETGNEVALKFLGEEKAYDQIYRERIEREAMAMARLRGTSSVYVHAFGRSERGVLYLVMERLYGKNFEHFLRESEKLGGRLKAKKLMQLLSPVATTLEAAHRHNIIHRDVKPSNVFVVDREHGGGVRLLDFGLAKLLDLSALTEAGLIAGTPSYIAPEAWKGKSHTLDARADVYGLGVIVFRALGGRPPFRGKDLVELCRMVTTSARPSLVELRPGLPPTIDSWVKKALAIDPAARFPSIREMWAELGSVLAVPDAAPF